MACPPWWNLTTQSAEHIVERELCLYLLGWNKSCSILDDGDRDPTDETPSGDRRGGAKR
jgi:hypothetical protein